MEETTKPPLVNPEYEKDITLKADLMKNLYANCLRKLTNGRETVSIPTSSKLIAIRYTGIPASVYPDPENKCRASNATKFKIRPIIEDIIQDCYEKKEVLPVSKHISKSNNPAWTLAISRKEFSKEELSILLNVTNLPILLKDLGYYWHRLPGTDKQFVAESPAYVSARHQYLKRLKLYRKERRTIIYLDVFSLSEKLEAYTDVKLAGANFVIIGISSATGLLYQTHLGELLKPTDIIGAIDAICRSPATFEDSVIVFGDDSGVAEVRSKIEIKSPDRTEMVAWLEENGIPYREDMHKCELFDLCNKIQTKAMSHCKFDAAFAAMGQFVNNRPKACIHRPKWMNHFGISHEFWMKARHTRLNKNNDIMQTKGQGLRFFRILIAQLKKTKWEKAEQNLIKKETRSYERDNYVEDVIEKVTTMVKENGLSTEDLDLNDFDEVSPSDDEDR